MDERIKIDELIASVRSEGFSQKWNAKEALRNLRKPPIEPFISALSDDNASVREIACEPLGQIGGARATEALVSALRDSDFGVRFTARITLETMNDPSVDVLMAVLSDPDPKIRESVTKVLVNVGPAGAIRPLIKALESENKDLRQVVAMVLGQIGHHLALGPLVKVLSDVDPQVRASAARALGSIATDEAVPALIKALRDQNEDVVGAAAFALAQLGDVRAVEPLVTALMAYPDMWEVEDALRSIAALDPEPLIDATSAKDPKVRAKILSLLSHTEDRRALQLIIDGTRDMDSSVRQEALATLGRFQDATAIGSIADCLLDPEVSVRKTAMYELCNMGVLSEIKQMKGPTTNEDSRLRPLLAGKPFEIFDDRAIGTLIDMLSDPDLCEGAAGVLRHFRDPRATEPLLRILESGAAAEWWTLPYIANAAAAMGEPAVSRLISIVIENQNRKVRDAASQALAEVDDVRAVDQLISELQNTSSAVRRAVAGALGGIRDKRAVQSLIVTLKDSDRSVRCAAATALGVIRDKDAVQDLILTLTDTDRSVRYAAAKALGGIGDQRAFAPLLACLDTELNEDVIRALGELGDVRATSPLLEFLWHPSSHIRAAAAFALGQIRDARAIEPLSVAVRKEVWVEHQIPNLMPGPSETKREDENEGVRQLAALALGNIGDPEGTEALLDALQDRSEYVRRAAATALGRIRDSRAIPPLIASVRDRAVREAADEALCNAPPIPTEEVRFTAFHPKEVVAEKWYTLLVYAYIEASLETVNEDARHFLDEIGGTPKTATSSSPAKLTRGTEITIQPMSESIRFNPKRCTLRWVEDAQRVSFRFCVDDIAPGRSIQAEIAVYVGPLLVGTLDISMLVASADAAKPKDSGTAVVTASAYKQESIFPSYSHLDREIVDSCKQAYKALGWQFLMDVDTLRSGEIWKEEIINLINQASIFQLFWSEHSARSRYVRQEWKHAIACQDKPFFVRPLFWKKPMCPPPRELARYHFAYIPLGADR